MGSRHAITFSVAVLCSLLFLDANAEPSAEKLTIRRGFATSFALSDAGAQALRPARARSSKIGPVDAKPGEITVGLAPLGGAVGVARLHVFERVARVVSFSVVAMRGDKRLAEESVCGHLETDTWVALPADTTTAVIDRFVEGDCER